MSREDKSLPNNTAEECCPRFDPEPWEDQLFEWQNKRFIKRRVFTFFYMPINFGSGMRKLDAEVRKSGARIQDNMSLSDHKSKWNMDLYVAVDREIPGSENVALSGKFYSRVYEGNFKDTDKWCKDYVSIVEGKGMKVEQLYMWYTTCPKCAKKYGKNYVVILGKVS